MALWFFFLAIDAKKEMMNSSRYALEAFECETVYDLRYKFNQYEWPRFLDLWKSFVVAFVFA